MNFSESVKRWRMDKGLKVIEAASRAGVTQPAWSEWEDENNTAQRKRGTCLKIARALELPEAVVLSAAGYDGLEPETELAHLVAVQVEKIPPSRRQEYRFMATKMLEALTAGFTSQPSA